MTYFMFFVIFLLVCSIITHNKILFTFTFNCCRAFYINVNGLIIPIKHIWFYPSHFTVTLYKLPYIKTYLCSDIFCKAYIFTRYFKSVLFKILSNPHVQGLSLKIDYPCRGQYCSIFEEPVQYHGAILMVLGIQ